MNKLIDAIELIAGIFLGVLALITCTEATLRYGFGQRIPDAYVFAIMLQGIAIAWGMATTTYSKTHITVDVLWEMVSPRGKAAIDIFAGLATFVSFAVLSWMVWRKTWQTYEAGEISNDLLMPVWPFMLGCALGLSCAALLALVRLVRDIQEMRNA